MEERTNLHVAGAKAKGKPLDGPHRSLVAWRGLARDTDGLPAVHWRNGASHHPRHRSHRPRASDAAALGPAVEIDCIVAKLLRKEPAERYARAEDVAVDLKSFSGAVAAI